MKVALRNKQTRTIFDQKIGWSWTCFCFGWLWGIPLKPYPSASGNAKCCSSEGGPLIEHIRNISSLRGRYDRLSSLFDRVPAALRRRGGVRALSDRDALA